MELHHILAAIENCFDVERLHVKWEVLAFEVLEEARQDADHSSRQQKLGSCIENLSTGRTASQASCCLS